MATRLLESPATARILVGHIARLEERLVAARTALDSVMAVEPDEEGTVIRFRKYEGIYSFAALKVGGRWFITQDGSRSSRQGHAPKSWDELLDWIGQRNWASIEVLA